MTMRHVVCFRFKPETTTEQVVALTAGLEELPTIIPEIIGYQVGPDLAVNDASWDFAVTADFEDTAGYLTYRDHPAHQALITTLVAPIAEQRAAVQFRL